MTPRTRPHIGRVAAVGVLWRAVRGRRPGAPGLVESVGALPRLSGSVLTGRYAGTSRRRLGLLVLGALYVVSPIDLVPELLPVLGVVDDIGVLAWLTGSVLQEADRFVTWEREGQSGPDPDAPSSAAAPTVVGEVVR